MMRNYLFLILTLLLPIFTQAQIEGLWIVTKVQVGEETPTPVAKWFDLKADGKLLSGNGGIINTRGNWSQEKDQLLFQNERGQANPAGPFQIQKEENTMTWTWEEEGMLVTIHLQANQSLPKASWDYLYGNWQIAEVWRDGKLQSQLPDADQPLSLFFRWDHQYTVRNASDDNLLSPGIWQIHGHRNRLRLLPFDPVIRGMTWEIEKINNHQLILSRQVEAGQISRLVFGR